MNKKMLLLICWLSSASCMIHASSWGGSDAYGWRAPKPVPYYAPAGWGFIEPTSTLAQGKGVLEKNLMEVIAENISKLTDEEIATFAEALELHVSKWNVDRGIECNVKVTDSMGQTKYPCLSIDGDFEAYLKRNLKNIDSQKLDKRFEAIKDILNEAAAARSSSGSYGGQPSVKYVSTPALYDSQRPDARASGRRSSLGDERGGFVGASDVHEYDEALRRMAKLKRRGTMVIAVLGVTLAALIGSIGWLVASAGKKQNASI